MTSAKPNVTFGFLGSTLDRAQGAERWSKWRPTVAMCQQEDLLISRLELLVEPKFADLAKSVVADEAATADEAPRKWRLEIIGLSESGRRA